MQYFFYKTLKLVKLANKNHKIMQQFNHFAKNYKAQSTKNYIQKKKLNLNVSRIEVKLHFF